MKQDDTTMRYLWKLMSEMFGRRWSDQYGDVPSESWAYALAGLEPEQLRRGVDAVRDSGASWPPSASEFRALCRGGSSPEQRAFQARVERQRDEPLPALEHVASRTEVGRKWLAWMVANGLRPAPVGKELVELSDQEMAKMTQAHERELHALKAREGVT